MSKPHRIDPFTFPLTGVRLIEASAGTGKTYTIAALYLRLILGHDLPGKALLPPDILVVTFTEAATQELRDRIRTRLTQAAAYFRDQAVEQDPFLQQLRSAYSEERWPGCAYRLELAANWMDEAAVYTIHGWCNRMLQQHAFASGNLFYQDVDTDDQELLLQVVRDYWRRYFYPLSNSACSAVYKLATSPEHLAQLLKPLLFETEAFGLDCTDEDIGSAFQEWDNWDQQRRNLETHARNLWLSHQAELEALLVPASEQGWLNGTVYKKASFREKLHLIAAWARHGADLTLKELQKFGLSKLQAGLSKAHQDKADLFVQPTFQSIDAYCQHVSAEIDIGDRITRHAIHWIRSRYETEKLRIARITFQDMLTRLDAALHQPTGDRLSEAIRQQFPIALIDEFQDTDPVQYRIFAHLYPSDTVNDLACFMIGDPKQAIYSFRGGDIFTYLKAHQATEGRHYTLDTNFRSTAALVAGVNQIFSFAEAEQNQGAFCFKQETKNPLPFTPVAAQGRKDIWLIDRQPAPALTLWHIPSETALGLPAYRAQLAETTASQIVHLLDTAMDGKTGFQAADGNWRNLQPADIAILVRSNTEANAMRKALATRQLRSVYLSERESIFSSAEAGDMLIWLQALAEPRNERKVRAALSTATLGWSYQSLQQLTWDEAAWEQHLERFLSYRQRWQKDGILPTLRQLMSDYALPSALMNRDNGERSLTNLLHLAELLQQASSRLEGEPALIRYLTETMATTQSAEESVIRLESDANLIKIITIHKSKGLEYPLVFLPFICSFREVCGRNNSYYRYHDTAYKLGIDLSKTEEIQALSDKERLQEDLRLLYVAITRARYACWLGVAAIKTGNSKSSQLDKTALGYLMAWQSSTPANALPQKLALIKGDCEDIAIIALPAANPTPYQARQTEISLDTALFSKARIADNWWIASYSALQTEHTCHDTPFRPDSENIAETYRDDKQNDEADIGPLLPPGPITGLHSLPRGAGPGVLIHELLEQCAQAGFKTVQSQPAIASQLIAKLFKQPQWEDKRRVVETSLQDWLQIPLLPHASLSLADLEPTQYQAEMEFLLGVDQVDVQGIDALIKQQLFPGLARPGLVANQLNGLLKGFIDLVFVHRQQYYVLDYKFNSLGSRDADYTQPGLTTAMLGKRYDLQAVLYLLALHRLLKVRLGTSYDYDRDLGGCVYLFLRGVHSASSGRVFAKPPKSLILSLDRMFANIAQPETAI